jgi:hypothetical protein
MFETLDAIVFASSLTKHAIPHRSDAFLMKFPLKYLPDPSFVDEPLQAASSILCPSKAGLDPAPSIHNAFTDHGRFFDVCPHRP